MLLHFLFILSRLPYTSTTKPGLVGHWLQLRMQFDHPSVKWEVKFQQHSRDLLDLLWSLLVIRNLHFISLFAYLSLYLIIYFHAPRFRDFQNSAIANRKHCVSPLLSPLYQPNTQHLWVIWNTLWLCDNSLTSALHLFELESARSKPPDNHFS